jgi:hypothetical protein
VEKLLSKQQKAKGGTYAVNVTGPRTKNIFFAIKGTKIFLPAHGKDLNKSTLFRMYYLSQPLTGLVTKISQLFSGRVIFSISSGCGRTEY